MGTSVRYNESAVFATNIFEPFAQERADARSNYHGTGLGMSIVKKMIDKMGGTISVTSEVGKGSAFVVELPFEMGAAPEKSKKEEADKENSIYGLNLMLVEDNELNAEVAEILLEDEGAIITMVNDGQQAVELFNNNPVGTFDAILMDIMMPVMDGLTATKAIRALNRPDAGIIPIIAMTANAFAEDV
ncbi:response regulator [Dorea formicigenerans]|nr:response regulator [Dorea formicigenerans]UWP20864.1 response regulator [Dorea formicigenerans]